MVDLRGIREIRGVGELNPAPVRLIDMVDHGGSRGHEIEAVLPLQPLLYDIEMEKSQEAAAEAEAERRRGLRLIAERGVVKLKLLQGIPKVRVLRRVRGIDAAENHALDLLIAGEGLLRRSLCRCHGVPDPRIPDIFDGGREISHHAGRELLAGDEAAGPEVADLRHRKLRPARHQADRGPLPDTSLFDPAKDDDTPVGVVERVEDQRLQGIFRIPSRSRELLHDGLQHLLRIFSGFCGDAGGVHRLDPDHILDLFRRPLGICGGEVDLVDDRQDLKIMIQREIGIRERLRLDPLARIHDQDRAVAGCESPGYLVIKVHMTRRIDEVKNIFLPVPRPIDDSRGLRFNRDSPLPLDIHIVEDLGLHFPLRESACHLQDAVREGGFPVVNVGNDAKIPDPLLLDTRHLLSSML